MDEREFLRGIEGEEQQGSDLTAGAEHLVRLKIQSGQQTEQKYPDLELEKKAGELAESLATPATCKRCGKIKTACMCGKGKYAYEIQPSSRPDIARSDFAQPHKEEAGHEGKYPIPDRQHAKSALGFAKMHHDAGAEAAVRKKVEQKYPDMLHGDEHEKNANLRRLLEKARLEEKEKNASSYENVKNGLKAALKKSPATRAALIGGAVGGIPNAAMGAATAPEGDRARSAVRMGVTGGLMGAGGGALYHHLNTKLANEWPHSGMLAATSGIGALAGGVGTYLASRPQKDTGKGKAEEELEAMVKGNKGKPERGLLEKMKNRETENAHGFAKAFREHPLKAALIGALTGGVSGYGIGQIGGAIARHRGGK